MAQMERSVPSSTPPVATITLPLGFMSPIQAKAGMVLCKRFTAMVIFFMSPPISPIVWRRVSTSLIQNHMD